MRYVNRKHLGLAAVAIAFAAAPAFAQGKGHGHDKGDKGDRGDRGRGRDEQVMIMNNGDVGRVPPGLAKKPGGLPPGQYKKRYTPVQGVGYLRDAFTRHGYTVVRTSPYGSSQYVYYRTPNGALQRAVIYPGSQQLGFSNVPSLIVQEVLSRLY